MSSVIKTPWSSVGYLVMKRTYARRLNENNKDSPTEEWIDICLRVIDACQSQLKVGFTTAEQGRLFDYMMKLKGTVAGRFLWQLGTSTVERLGLPSLQNCAFTSIDHPIRPFTWAFDMLMLGAGVGYNLQREFVYKLPPVKENFLPVVRKDEAGADFIVPDSREGWVKLLSLTLDSAFYQAQIHPGFTYSTQVIRGKGTPIKGFGGLASGPEDLCEGIDDISKILFSRAGKQLRPIDCLDIMNILGRVVVSGNVRRSAQIAIGDCDDLQFLTAKQWSSGNIPNWRAFSNNSVVCNDVKLLPQAFWDTYDGGSEPYGLINLKLSKATGRIGETQYKDLKVKGFNPCAEQSLADYETCVSGDTKIATKNGYFPIQDLVGKEVEIFNGESWSRVVPFMAKEKDSFTRIHFSDGSYLDANSDHEFMVNNKKKRKTKTIDLKVGDSFPKFELPCDGGSIVENAYLLGAYCGDGYVSSHLKNGKAQASLCASEQGKSILNGLSVGKIYSRDRPDAQTMYTCKVDIPIDLIEPLRDKSVGLPDCIMSMNKISSLEFLAGFIDTDGNVANTGECDNYRIFGTSEKKMRDLQLLCRRAGINHASLRVASEKGKATNYGIRNYDLYVLTIPSFECGEIPTRLKKANIIGSRYKTNNMYTEGRKIDSSSRQRITKLEILKNEGPSYCFNEPIKNMGVFGNVLTYQCCLSEIFLPNIESREEFLDLAKLLYRVNKHSLRLPCHHKETEKIVHENMRMGIGLTGVLQCVEKLEWCDYVYKELREYDIAYSAAHNWPVSIKLTTMKPSGSLSLLPGVTSGVHAAIAQYMIRRIRIASNHPLVETCKAHGYPVEFQQKLDGTQDYGTVVVEFPYAYPEGTILAEDITAIDQLEWVKKLQTVWSDNAVSCTVYYTPEQIPAIKEWLAKNYNKNCKSLSFLLLTGHGFLQAPFEEITKEEYEARVAKTTIISSVGTADFEAPEECAGGVCPIR